MGHRKISTIVFSALALLCLIVHSIEGFPFPQQEGKDEQRGRQDEDDDKGPTRANIFGSNVAQIIVGALTGNIDSIVKASFGFIDDRTANIISHNSWEQLKGNPTKTPPWLTTTKKPLVRPEDEDTDAIPAEFTTPPATPAPVQVSNSNHPTSLNQPVTPSVAQSNPVASVASPVAQSNPAPSSPDQQSTYNSPSAPVSQIVFASAPPRTTTPESDDDEDESEGESVKGKILEEFLSSTSGSSDMLEEGTTRTPPVTISPVQTRKR